VTGEAFSKEFRRFVRENIGSVEQVRVLVLLADDPERHWDTAALNAELGTSTHSIDLRLNVLLRRRLVVTIEEGKFKYRSDPEHDELVRELRDQFVERPVSVITLIYSSSLASFSDAFRIGGTDQEDG
jgi:hypothetical protein